MTLNGAFLWGAPFFYEIAFYLLAFIGACGQLKSRETSVENVNCQTKKNSEIILSETNIPCSVKETPFSEIFRNGELEYF